MTGQLNGGVPTVGTGRLRDLYLAFSQAEGKALTLNEAAVAAGWDDCLSPSPGVGYTRAAPLLWELQRRGYIVALPGFPWWGRRYGLPRVWGRWQNQR